MRAYTCAHLLRRFSTQQYPHSERPFTPELWTAMSTSHIQTIPASQSLQAILHSVSLMHSNITPFNYDFYQWSCNRLIQNQQELTKDEILMMMRLGCKYQVKIQPFHQHIENQLFLRIHRDYQYEMQEYDQKIQREMHAIMRQLQQKSKDYFKILNQEEKDEEKEEGKVKEIQKVQLSEEEQFIANMSKKISKKSRKGKEILMADIVQIVELLKANGSKNIALFQYILELITMKYQASSTLGTNEMLEYAKLITYLCQQLMQQYQQNKNKYTPRSIKRIFKFQLLYYHQHLRQLQIVKDKLTSAEVVQLVQNYSGFPIKRRQLRKNIALALSQEIKKRSLDQDNNFVTVFVGINGKDQKMKKVFCEAIGIQAEKAKELGLYSQKQKLLDKKDEEDKEESKEEEDSEDSQEGQQKDKRQDML